ncbi:M56 family metallopeptidase [Roseateles sp. BYS87W]|uniref:M56 family metallopeptidase n=1 Tax=Pelomonas baiyunensis TaxID=3299026 RepID=A0ABW7GVA7_9BURK
MADALLHALLRQALLLSLGVVLLALARPALRRASAGLSYLAWSGLPLLLLTAALPRPVQEPLHLLWPAQALAPTGAEAGGAVAAPSASALPLPATAWLGLWLAGTVLALLVQATRQWQLARHGSTLPAGSSPALVGLWRPRVMLPLDFQHRFTPAQQALILAHEHVHRARGDNLWAGVGTFIACLHWWNPLAWWGLARLRADQELACDAAVLRAQPLALTEYTDALLAAHGLTAPAAPLASRWGSVHPLVERVAMLKHARATRRHHLALLAATLLGAMGTSYALQAAPEAPPVVEGFVQLRFDIRLSLDGQEISHPRLNTFPAAPATVVFNEPNGPRLWKLTFTGRFEGDKHLMVDTELALSEDEAAVLAWRNSQGKAPPPPVRQVAAPRLLMQDGGSGRVETTTPDGQHRLTLEIRANSFRNPTPDYSAPKP